ncbi:hypothetical protein AAH994_00590 [Weeksellaceae bacterium A-14]|uniref:hypothetical protein n=1 Tax=Daejeonia sp. YH14 TaxID=3439042 RepID=UPI0031E4C8FC
MINKLFPLISIAVLLSSCSKKKRTAMSNETYQPPKYDTTAIDSFSAGATNVDIAAKIRMSSKVYKDSVAAVLKQQEEEKRLKALLDKEEERKKKEEEKKNNTTAEPAPVAESSSQQ